MGWIRFNLSGADQLEANLKNKTSLLQQALSVKVNALLNQLQTKLKLKIGQVMNRGYATGKLASSVTVEPATIEGDTIAGSVGIPQDSATYKYGRAHELGFERMYQITATKSRVLAFQLSVKANAQKVFARSVVHPPIPALHFTSTTQQENREEVIRQLEETVNEVLRRKP